MEKRNGSGFHITGEEVEHGENFEEKWRITAILNNGCRV
jgi:hypothetical protein